MFADTQPYMAPEISNGAQVAAAIIERQYCIFRVGRERYGLAVLEVEEVVEWPAVTRLPLAPPFLMGIFNFRGIIVPIVDIAFHEGCRPRVLPNRLIVALAAGKGEQNAVRIGIAADAVYGTRITTEPLLIDELPSELPHCCGMLHQDNELALILDLRRVAEAFRIPAI